MRQKTPKYAHNLINIKNGDLILIFYSLQSGIVFFSISSLNLNSNIKLF